MTSLPQQPPSPTKRPRLGSGRDVPLPTDLSSLTDWCATHGLLMVNSAANPPHLVHAPVTLFPTNFSANGFKRAQDLAPLFNKLVDAVAREETWLLDALKDAQHGDPFTKKLVDLFNQHGGSRSRQQMFLGIHRSDYMMDEATKAPLQIELNTISCSFACLSARVSKLHNYLLTSDRSTQSRAFFGPSFNPDLLPQNNADRALANALAVAHQKYREQHMTSSNETRIIFVVQSGERNAVDQRHLEHILFEEHGICVTRLTLAQVAELGEITADGTLLFKSLSSLIASVVYFRAGYTPEDHPTDKEWTARAMIEQSMAIKCPSISYHLVGAKKVQQRLAEKGVLEKFLDADEARIVRASFAGLWSLGNDRNGAMVDAAIKNPQAYVVKPQREGGGNNIYGDAVRIALQGGMSADVLSAHILMERIFPAKEFNVLIRHGQLPRSGDCISELGIFSVFLGDGKTIHLNEKAGHLLRTKLDGTDEGGVAAGFSFLNSPYLGLQ